MNDLSQTRLWLMRAAFLFLALVILFFHLLPLTTTPSRWTGPDLLLGFACAWSLRRPEYVPALALALAFLMADLLLQRPPGLWALLALMGSENLKSRGRNLRDSSFAVEWLTVGVVIIMVMMANRFLLAISLVEVPHLPLVLSELGMTLLFYPLIVLVTHGLMRVRKTAPGDLDAHGQRA
ncbi:rod shape-determining protein MreD [Sulfitobacter sp. M368]|uniref:rod shape-determining protein MreD n=1 Tax=Sulfitobacter sp. M368 TaxID=2867021 RepID=UPI0021A6A4C3|nr:rod shape-determining protein MreD [Sulfitobacter sp. M368]UWR15003.1 rod shape-determining protein MreD [Sulfitobacter sp. M368]